MGRNKLAAVIATMAALHAGAVSALGLGEFSLTSSLNQPLDGEIKLLNVGDLSDSQVIIDLASDDDFKRAGVSRDYFLTGIDFEVVIDEQGNGVVKLSTDDRVIEPYLNFLVEVRWPNGRLLREYTVLLDLPTYSQAPAPQVQQAPQSTSAPAAAQVTPTKRSAASSSVPAGARSTLSEGSLDAGSSYRVKQGDTLWRVAAKSRPSNGTVEQTMLGIQRLNPNAFTSGNINNLKAGYVLRLPTQNDIADIPSTTAVDEVAAQNRAWKTDEPVDSSLGAQLDARTNEPAVARTETDSARLSITSGGTTSDGGAGDGEGGAGTEALRNELDAAKEMLDKTDLENDELESRLRDMESKLATMQRLVELKDDQLAALQGVQQEQSEAQSSVVDPSEEPEQASVGEAASDTSATPVAKPVEPAQAADKPKPEPKPAPKPAPESGLFENPLVLGGAAVAILLAIVALLMRRKKSGNNDDALELVEETSDEAVVDTEEELAAEDAVDELEDASVGDFATEMDAESDSVLQTAEDEPEEEAAPVQSETGDAIAEADIYIAYGRYQQAVDLLKTGINQEPGRADLRMKLLEVYIETLDKPGFQEQFVELQGLGDEESVAEVKEMLSSVDGVSDWLEGLSGQQSQMTDAEMDADLIEGDDELDLDLDAPENPTIEADAITSDDELELDLDEDFDGLDTQKTVQFEAVDLEAEAQAEAGAEFELDLDEEISLDDSETITSEDDLELELDLDSDSSDDSELSLDAEEPAKEDEGFDLDLDGDLDLDMDLGELSGDTDLDSLEAEFDTEGASSDAADTTLELDIAEDADDEPELDLELDAASTDSEDTLDLSADMESMDLEAEPEPEPEPEPQAPEAEAVPDESVDVSADDDDFDFLSDTDEVATKLDLARAYIDMGDTEGAKDILDEVLQEGSDEQKSEANGLLERI